MNKDNNTRPHMIIDLGEEEKKRVDKLIDTGEGKLARKIQSIVEESLREDGQTIPEGVEVVPIVLLYRVKRKSSKNRTANLLDPLNLAGRR